MAKWGEGDPRWIVEERADATNVNNWHWTEKNASAWSRDKIKSLLFGLKVETDEGCCEITEVSKIEGEASASNRKAKLIFFYEWELKAEWQGYLTSDPNTKYKGKLEVNNLSDENDASELDVSVTVTSTKDEAHKVKEMMRLKGGDLVREQLGIYMKDLRTEFTQGMILPSKNQAQNNTTKPVETNTKKIVKETINTPIMHAVQSAGLGVKIPTKKLSMTEVFQCPPGDLYRALTEIEWVQAFTRERLSVYEVEKGGRFVLFHGNVTGTFTDLVPQEKLCMRWRRKEWPSEHYSDVTIEISPKDHQSELKMTQTGVPTSYFDSTKDGWSQYYWHSIKQTFGYDPKLF